ncbi:MAG: zf-HC2 domain-containing protein [Deltaproteobacteria bacterium]|nr:zf-HC2 domain-containing protein [Deltaproteobacteria bacterium]
MESPETCEARDERLSVFVDGQLGQRERVGIEAHLDGCERCRQEVARFGRLSALLREADAEALAALPEVSLWEPISAEITSGPRGGILGVIAKSWENLAPVWARPVWVPLAIGAALALILALPLIKGGGELQADEAIVESVDEGEVMVIKQGNSSTIIWVFDD